MKRFLFIFLLLLRFAAVSLAAAELRILCTADLHGELARFSALLPAMRRAGGDHALWIDLGDLSQGNFDVANAGFPVMVEALNRAGYDLRVPGNHDFETGIPDFAAEFAAFRGTNLGADWNYGGAAGIPWKLVERGGVRCAVIGLTDPKMSFRMAPDRQGRFLAPFSALAAVMPEVRRAKPDLVVLARHAGLQGFGGPLAKLLGAYPEIHIVLGAHTHEEHPGEEVAGAWYVQPGARAASAALVTVTVDDRSRRIVGITSKLLRPDLAAPDPGTRKLCEEIQRHSSELRQRRFPRSSRSHQEILGAAMLHAAGADAALSSCRDKALNAPAPRTEAELFARQPFHDGILCFRLTGEEYRALCRDERRRSRKYSLRLVVTGVAPEQARGELQVATSEYFATNCPTLSRILSARGVPRWRRIPGTVRDLCRRELLSPPR